ncbi:MAG: tRNA lysidine(34) synthetase TilS [Flavobacteriales bacterium]
MFEEFKSHLINEFPFLFNNKILIATSSGVDSVVLCNLCNDLGLDFSIAHCNFSLRGEESDEDAKFAEALAKLLNVDFYLKKFNTISYKENSGLSTQMAARELRYKWFDDLLINYDCLLTAHHLDDQLETFLMNLSRGSGLGGLLGIPIMNKKKIRPLLSFSKNQIVNYARENNISWREDSSNLSNDYLRNEIRNNVIPEFKKSAPDLLKNFNKSLNYLKNSKSYIQEKINETSKKIIFDEGHQVKYDIKEILRLDNLKMYLFEFFHKFGFNQLTDIENILTSQSGKQILSKTHRIVKDRDFLILEEISNMSFVSIDVGSDAAQVDTIYGSLFFNLSLNFEKSVDPSSVYVDLGKLVYPLRVEVYSKGMEFIPFGMSGKKSLSKFFKDKKLSIIDKNRSLVLVNGNNELIWVVNQRMDDRYKITESTSRILKISFN